MEEDGRREWRRWCSVVVVDVDEATVFDTNRFDSDFDSDTTVS